MYDFTDRVETPLVPQPTTLADALQMALDELERLEPVWTTDEDLDEEDEAPLEFDDLGPFQRLLAR